jgi:hypothetical protein
MRERRKNYADGFLRIGFWRTEKKSRRVFILGERTANLQPPRAQISCHFYMVHGASRRRRLLRCQFNLLHCINRLRMRCPISHPFIYLMETAKKDP